MGGGGGCNQGSLTPLLFCRTKSCFKNRVLTVFSWNLGEKVMVVNELLNNISFANFVIYDFSTSAW